jgi:hypothetical protein
MRVIRTEMYFDRSQLVGSARLRPRDGSVSFAWMPTRTNASIPLSALDGVVINRRYETWAASVQYLALLDFIDFSLRGGTSKTAYYPSRKKIYNTDAVQEVIRQSIIVEYSPPSEMPLSTLLQKSTHAGIGYYIGSAAAGSHHWLMFLSVPAAIVVVGAAVGVSDGLVRGLPKVVETAVERWKPQPDPNP